MFAWKVSLPSKEGRFVQDLRTAGHLDHIRTRYGNANETNVALLIVSWTSLIADTPRSNLRPNCIINRFIKTAVDDLFGLIERNSRLAHELASQLVRVEGKTTTGPYLKGMERTPVFPEYLEFFRTGDPELLRYVLTFLLFGKKLYYENSELDAISLQEWLKVEERLGALNLPPVVENLKRVASVIFGDWEVDDFLPVHGSGAVAEREVRGVEAKNLAFMPSKLISRVYLSDRPLTAYSSSVDYTPSGNAALSEDKPDIARLKFVPKDFKKTRSICMEPIDYMWAQQAVRRWLENYLSSSRFFRNHVFLHDQRKNQEASQFGSKTGLVDTIDLSSASDSVSWELVKRVFPSKVLKHLMATRTYRVELPDGSVQKVHKFAPMGSAVCFPVQTILYSIVSQTIGICQACGLDWRQPGCFDGMSDEYIEKLYRWTFRQHLTDEATGAYQPFLAYGDDIVLDRRMTSSVVECLSMLGFKVNIDKSFRADQAFRESCGEYHFDGHAVTPMFFKIKKLDHKVSVESMAGIIEHANRAFEFGYKHLRSVLVRFALYMPIHQLDGRHERNPILFSDNDDDSFSIISDAPHNRHLRKRVYNANRTSAKETCYLWQRDEVQSITAGPGRKRRWSKQFENYRFIAYWRSRYNGDRKHDGDQDYRPDPMGHFDPPPASPVAADTLGVGVSWRWTAATI